MERYKDRSSKGIEIPWVYRTSEWGRWDAYWGRDLDSGGGNEIDTGNRKREI